MPIRQTDLLNKTESYREVLQEAMEKSASAGLARSAFLCHSHLDQRLIKGLIAYFSDSGIKLYIDWKDHSMPKTPNHITAKKIQLKIVSCDLFFFLATQNSKASRWCPWEIGYADSSRKKVYIIPTYDSSDTYGNEYLQLYSKIDLVHTTAKSGLAVYKRGGSQGLWVSEKTI